MIGQFVPSAPVTGEALGRQGRTPREGAPKLEEGVMGYAHELNSTSSHIISRLWITVNLTMTACNWKTLSSSPSPQTPRLQGSSPRSRYRSPKAPPQKTRPTEQGCGYLVAGSQSKAISVNDNRSSAESMARWQARPSSHPRRRPRTGRSSFLLPHRHWGQMPCPGSDSSPPLPRSLPIHPRTWPSDLATSLNQVCLAVSNRRTKAELIFACRRLAAAAAAARPRHHAAPPPRPPMSSSPPRSVTPVARHASPPTTVSATHGPAKRLVSCLSRKSSGHPDPSRPTRPASRSSFLHELPAGQDHTRAP
jgi:hypothetical protein